MVFFKSLFMSSKRIYVCRAGGGEEERKEEEEEEELLPDRSEPSLSLLLDLLAERDWRAGFFFFLLIFGTEASPLEALLSSLPGPSLLPSPSRYS